MKRKLFSILLTVFIVLCMVGSVQAATWYVNSQTGLDTYDGTSATLQGGGVGPKLTIQAAVNAATASDIISVAGVTGTKYNVEPGNLLTINKNLSFVVTAGADAGTPLIGDAVTITATATFSSGTFFIDDGITVYLNGGDVVGSANIDFSGTACVIRRAADGDTFDAAPTTNGTVNLTYDNANITVGPEWTSTTAIFDVLSSQAGGNTLTLGGSKTMNGGLTTTAGGVLALAGNTLTLNAVAAESHTIAGNITSTSVSSGGLVFTGSNAGNTVAVGGAGDLPSVQKSTDADMTFATTDIIGSLTLDAGVGTVVMSALATIEGNITHAGSEQLTLTQNLDFDGAGAVTCTASGAGEIQFDGNLTDSGTLSIVRSGTGIADFDGTVSIAGDYTSSSTGVTDFGAAVLGVDNVTISSSGNATFNAAATILGNVTNSGTAVVEFLVTAAITGDVTNSGACTANGESIIDFGDGGAADDATIGGNVLNSATVVNPAANVTSGASITFDAGADVDGNITNQPTLTNDGSNDTDIDGSGLITFADNDLNDIDGNVVNNPTFSWSNSDADADADDIGTSGNITFAHTTNNVDIAGTLTNSATANNPAAGTGDGDFTGNGRITIANTTGTSTFGGIVNSTSGMTDADIATCADITFSAITTGNLTVTSNGIVNSSTCSGFAAAGDINTGPSSILDNFVLAITGDVVISGATGTGDIILGDPTPVADDLTITGAVINSKSVAGANIHFQYLLSAITITGKVTNSGASNILFDVVDDGQDAVTDVDVKGLENSGSGTIDFTAMDEDAGTCLAIGTDGITISAGNITMGSATLDALVTVGGNINVSGGTLLLGGAAYDKALAVTGNITVTGGIFNFSSVAGGNDDITVSGNLTISGGTFDAALTPASTGDLDVAGNYVHTGGTLDLGAGAKSFTVAGTANEYTASATIVANSSATLTFDGTALQTFDVSSGGTALMPIKLTINNTVADSSWKLINGNLQCVEDVTFTDGVVKLVAQTLFIVDADFNYNVAVADAYLTENIGFREGFISMQGTGNNNLTIGIANVPLANFEVDKEGAAEVILTGQNCDMAGSGIFALTGGKFNGTTTLTFDGEAPWPTIRVVDGIIMASGDIDVAANKGVNVTYLKAGDITSSFEISDLDTDELNDLNVNLVGGNYTLTLGSAITCNGQISIRAGERIATGANNITMADDLPDSSDSKIVFNGDGVANYDIISGGGTLHLAHANGTEIVGLGGTGANANTITMGITVADGSAGNTVTGIRKITGNVVLTDNSELSVAFVNETSTSDVDHILGNLTLSTNNGVFTLASDVQMQGNYSNTGTVALGDFDLSINTDGGPTLAQDGTATVTAGTGEIIVMGDGGGAPGTVNFNITTSDATIPNFTINFDAANDIVDLNTNNLIISNTFNATMGVLKDQTVTVTGNTMNVTTDASFSAASLGLTPTTGTLTATIDGGGNFTVPTLTIDGDVTLAGSATGLEATTAFVHTSGLLDFGTRTLTMTAPATFSRTTGTYAGTGYMVWNSAGNAFNQSTGSGATAMTIPNLRVSGALTLLDAVMMTVTDNLEIGNAVLDIDAGTAPASPVSYMTVGDTTGRPIVTVTHANANVTGAAVTFVADHYPDYIFATTAGGNITVPISIWPTSIAANDVTINMNGSADKVVVDDDLTMAGDLYLTQGELAMEDNDGLTCTGTTITRTHNSHIDLDNDNFATDGVGYLVAGDVTLAYVDDGDAGADDDLSTGPEYTEPTSIVALTSDLRSTVPVSQTLTINDARVCAGDVTTADHLIVSGATTFSGNVTVGGNFATSAAATVGGNLAVTGTSGITTGPLTVTGNYTSTGAVANSSALNVTGIYTCNGGITTSAYVTCDSNFVMATGTNAAVGNNQRFRLRGDVTLNGSAAFTNAGTVLIDGTTAQTYTSGTTAFAADSLWLNNTAGMTLGGTNNLNCSGSHVHFDDGLLFTGTNSLVLQQSVVASQPYQGFSRSVSGQEYSHVVGNVQKLIPTGGITGSASAITRQTVVYPVGTENPKYRPATLYFDEDPGSNLNITINHTDESATGTNGFPLSSDVGTITNYADFYWTITSDVDMSASKQYGIELVGTGYTDYPESSVEDIRLVRRFGISNTNEWRMQSATGFDNSEDADLNPTVKAVEATGGITDQGAIFTFSMTSQAPTWVTAPAAGTVNEADTLVLEYKADDVDLTETATISVVGDLPSFATFALIGSGDSATVTLIPTYTDSGDYSFTLNASDGTNSLDTVTIIRVDNVNQPVAFATVPADTTMDEGTAYTFTYGITDADAGDLVYYAIVDTPATDAAISAAGVVTFTTQNGTPTGQVDTLVVSITDSVDTPPVVLTDTLLVTVVEQVAPVFTLGLADQTLNTGDTLTHTYTTTDANGDTVAYAIVVGPDGLTLTGADLLWAPADDQVGDSALVVVSATDATGLAVNDTAYINVNSMILGDASLNGVVSAFDASLVLQHVANLITLTGDSLTLADATQAAGVSALDASYILQKVAGNDSLFRLGGLSKTIASAGNMSWERLSTEDEDMLNVPMTLKNASNVYSVEYTAEVDPSIIKIEDVSANLPKGWQMVKSIDNGVLTVAMAGTTPLKDAMVANVQLRILDKNAVFMMTGNATINENNSRDLETLEIKQVPAEFKLSQNYPNPFNPTTTINFQLPENNKVMINIYDILGNKIKTLVKENKTAGYYTVMWNGLNDRGAQMASGTYFYHIQAGKHNSTKKMLLIK